MKTILAAVKYHAEREYPYLIVQNDPYSPMTLQAINLNDRYLITELMKKTDAKVKESIEILSNHLGALPSNIA